MLKSTSKGDFNKLRSLRRLYIKSLLTRIRSVRNVINVNYHDRHDKFVLTIDDKIHLISNLRYSLNFDSSTSFIVTKKKFTSFFFEDSNLYISCLKCLYLDSILPIIDSTSDRSYIFYRPFRYCQTILANIKNIFMFKIKSPWIIQVDLFFIPNKSYWLINNFPFLRLSNDMFFSFSGNCIKNKLFFTLFNFLLNGLVRHSKIHNLLYLIYQILVLKFEQ